jgi:hypothetical protein
MSNRYSLKAVAAGFAAIAVLLCGGLRLLGLSTSPIDAGSFLLTVERVYETEEDIVVRLLVATAEPLHRQIWSPGVTSAWLASLEHMPAQRYASADSTGEIWIFGSSLVLGRDRVVKVDLGNGGSLRQALSSAHNNPRLYITIQSGKFPTGRPIRIGHVDGEPVFLAVGQPMQLNRLKEQTINQPALAGKMFRRAPCFTLRSV